MPTTPARWVRSPAREPPFFFTKPADAVVADGATIPFPTADRRSPPRDRARRRAGVGRRRHRSRTRALDCVYGYAAGIDLTRRDLQSAAAQGRAALGHVQGLRQFRAHRRHSPRRGDRPSGVAGASRCRSMARSRQQGDLSDMIWNLPKSSPRSRQCRAFGRRPDLHRHAGRRRRDAARRQSHGRASPASARFRVALEPR